MTPYSFDDLIRVAKSMIRFGFTSLLGTLCDFLSFTFIFTSLLPVFSAEVCAALIGMIINFFMQKRFVFNLTRNVHVAFLLSILFSFILMFAGAFGISLLSEFAFFSKNLAVAKILVMGVKFVLNYYSKKWVFESCSPLRNKVNQ